MTKWVEATLGEIAAINPESTPKSWEPSRAIRYVDIASVARETGIAVDALEPLPFGEAPGRARRVIRGGDVLVSTVRPNLRAFAVVPSELDGEVASTGFAVVRGGERVLPGFLWVIISSDAFVDAMVSRCTGSNYPAIRAADVSAFPISIPSLAEQRHILDVVSAVDAQIDALAKEADSIASTLEGLLWMDSFRTDEWQELPFAEVVDFREGPGIMARDFHDSGVPLIRLAGLTPGVSLLTGCNFLDPTKVDAKWAHFRLATGDVLLSTSAALGRVAVVGEEAIGSVPYTGIIRMRPADERVLPAFIPWLLRSAHFAGQVASAGVGTTMAHFGPTHLRQMKAEIPTCDEQRRIVATMESVWDEHLLVVGEVVALRSFRSALVTSLLDREIEIPQSYTDLLEAAS